MGTISNLIFILSYQLGGLLGYVFSFDLLSLSCISITSLILSLHSAHILQILDPDQVLHPKLLPSGDEGIIVVSKRCYFPRYSMMVDDKKRERKRKALSKNNLWYNWIRLLWWKESNFGNVYEKWQYLLGN